MDARPTPEQRELDDAATRLAARLGPATVGELDDDDRHRRLAAAVAQAGWRQLRAGEPTAPVASGVEAALVARCFARKTCDTAFIGPLLAADLLRRAGLPTDETTSVAMSSDLRRLAVAGRPAVAIDVAGATHALALDAAGNRLVRFELPADGRGGLDLTRPSLAIGPEAGFEELDAAVSDADLRAWTALGAVLATADLVGVMEGAVALSAEYAKERRQYGAAIGSYQAVQHLLAEGLTLAEGALGVLFHAAWAVDELEPDDAAAAAAVAKAYASRAARTVCETAIQVHGGIGNTWECLAHVYLRRALLSTELFGADADHLADLAARRWGGPHGLS